MKTTDLELLISLYMDGELSEPMKNKVLLLLETDKQAALMYDKFLHIRTLLQSTPRLVLPTSFSCSIMADINQCTPDKPYTRVRLLFNKHRRVAIITTVAVSVCCLCLIPIFMTVMRSPVETAALNVGVPQTQVTSSVTEPAVVSVSKLPVRQEETGVNGGQTVSPGYLMTPAVPLSFSPSASSSQNLGQEKRAFVACKLKAGKSDSFYFYFQQISSERKLSFTKSVRSGHIILEYTLTMDQFQKLVFWLEKRTDYVESVNIIGDLVKWQKKEEDASVDETPNTLKTETRKVRFEFN